VLPSLLQQRRRAALIGVDTVDRVEDARGGVGAVGGERVDRAADRVVEEHLAGVRDVAAREGRPADRTADVDLDVDVGCASGIVPRVEGVERDQPVPVAELHAA